MSALKGLRYSKSYNDVMLDVESFSLYKMLK